MGPVFCLCIDASYNIKDILLWNYEEMDGGRGSACECKSVKVVPTIMMNCIGAIRRTVCRIHTQRGLSLDE
jgi:hypothetical protein